MNVPCRFLFLTALVLLPAAAPAQTRVVYAWRNFAGQPGASGTNDGAADAARFYFPASVATDTAGDVYVADSINYTIRKVTSAGAVTTLAGRPGSYGTNDGAGTAARFSVPSSVAVDGAGNVYVADQNNHTIRRVTSAGVVTTLAGLPGTSGTNDGVGNAARFSYPTGVAVDVATNLYAADFYNHTIRKITSAGVVTTLAGWAGQSGTNDANGTAARFHFPGGVAVDSAGNVYVADLGNHTIRKVTSGGVVTTLAGSPGNSGTNDGPGSTARFYFPQGVAVDGAGNVLVADRFNHTIRKVTSAGLVTTLGGSPGLSGDDDGPGSVARFNSPYGVAADSAGNLYVADTYNQRISKGTPLPALVIQRSGTGLVISWPASPTGFVLQESPNPANPAGWSDSDFPVANDGTNKSLTILSPAGNRFFRLSKSAPPALTIRCSGSSVIVSWHSSATGFIPKENPDPANVSGWSNSAYAVTDDGTNKSITIPSPTGNLFFRLESN